MIGQVRILVIVVIAAMASVLLAASIPDAILAGDAEPYRARMAELFSGKVPYFDFPFEHLPGSLIPLALAWLSGGFIDLRHYAFALAGVSTLLIAATSLVMRRLEAYLGEGLTLRWVVPVIPLMPFLLFRNDSWPVLLVAMAFLAAASARPADASGLISLGIASKFWPVAWVPIEWWRGRRRQAVALTLLGIGALVLLRSDPILQVQRPVGVHTETLAGSLVGLSRALAGDSLQIVRTSAAYIDVPWSVHLINLVPGLVFALWSLRALRSPFSWPGAWRLMGALTGAIVVASPLLSTQFLAWLAPFTAAGKRLWVLALLINSISLFLIITWTELFIGHVWWWLVLVARNFLLLGQILALVRPLPGTLIKTSRGAPI